MAFVDVVPVLIDYLKEDPEVSILVGNNIYGEEVPRNMTSGMPIGLITLASGGGEIPFERMLLNRFRIDLRCFGTSPNNARQIYNASAQVLKEIVRLNKNNALIHHVNPSLVAISLRDPETEWPFNFSSWTVLASEVNTSP